MNNQIERRRGELYYHEHHVQQIQRDALLYAALLFVVGLLIGVMGTIIVLAHMFGVTL